MSFMEVAFQQELFFSFCAGLSTLLFIVSYIFLLFGGGGGSDLSGDISTDVSLDGSVDVDVSHDTTSVSQDSHLGSEAAFKLFSTQSILAFFMGMGWVGLTLRLQLELTYVLALPIAVAFGAVLMLITAWFMSKVMLLNRVIERNQMELIGKTGQVYLSVPSSGEGVGKVELVAHGSKKIMNAITKGERIETRSPVEVVGFKDHSTLIVREPLKLSKGEQGND